MQAAARSDRCDRLTRHPFGDHVRRGRTSSDEDGWFALGCDLRALGRADGENVLDGEEELDGEGFTGIEPADEP